MKTKGLSILRLRKELTQLNSQYSVVALKTGTEIEDMDFKEIAYLKKISHDIIPLIVKIGGPEARNDMRECLAIGVEGILAPMVETVYALTNFVKTIKEIISEGQYKMPSLAINLESITAATNLDAMIQSVSFRSLDQVTIGRGDLSGSMHLDTDDDEVLRLTATCIRKIKNQKIRTSVGGGLKLSTIDKMVDVLPSNRFNTRHIVFRHSRKFKKESTKHLFEGLRFEKHIYEALIERFPGKLSSYIKRVETLKERMGQLDIIEGRKSNG